MDYTVTEAQSGMTILRYVKNELGLSRRILIRLKQTGGGICVNGSSKTVRAILTAGDVLSLRLEDEYPADGEESYIKPVELPVEIVYEDGDLLAVDKPYGMPTHASYGHTGDTLQNAAAYIFEKRNIPFVFRAVNRLDRDTSGLVLIAKNQLAAYKMSSQLMSGRVKKVYRAVLDGVIEPERGKIEAYIRRRQESIIERVAADAGTESEYALTEYERLAQNGKISVVDASPVTGRTHQLRVHFASVGHPVTGDTLYGAASERIGRQALHAYRLEFDSLSGDGRITVTAPVPGDILSLYGDFYFEKGL